MPASVISVAQMRELVATGKMDLRIGQVTHLTHWVRIKCESDAGDRVGVRSPGCVDGFERGRGGFKPQAHVGWEWTFVHGANVPGNMPRSSSSTWRW